MSREAFRNRNRWFPECLAVSKGGSDMPAVPTLSETPHFEVHFLRSNSTDLAHRRPANWSRSDKVLYRLLSWVVLRHGIRCAVDCAMLRVAKYV